MTQVPGITPRGPYESLTAAVSAEVNPGQVVIANQNVTTATAGGLSTVSVATSGSELVVGVALTSAAPTGTDSATDAGARPEIVTVCTDGEVEVTAEEALKFGDPLRAGNAGKVLKWRTGTDTAAAQIGQWRSTSTDAAAKGIANIEGSGG